MKEKFNQLIADTVKPFLKTNGFAKKGMNFYRKKDDLIFLFNFQNSQSNSFRETKFYINCAIHSTKIDKVIGKTERSEPKEYECYFRDRISSITQSINDGYFLKENTDLPNLSLTIITDLKTVILMFDNIQSTNDLIDLMINENGLNNYSELFEYLILTENKKGLKHFVKQLHGTFGTEERWTIFEDNLNEILKKNGKAETVIDILNEK
jgi:hypothetical protein